MEFDMIKKIYAKYVYAALSTHNGDGTAMYNDFSNEVVYNKAAA